jgi:hypothetical protein
VFNAEKQERQAGKGIEKALREGTEKGMKLKEEISINERERERKKEL